MKTRHICIAFLILLSGCFTACNSRNNKYGENDTLITQDSIITTHQSVEPERLPDTIFDSAKQINYKVTVKDTVNTAVLSSVKDLYIDTPGAFTFRKGSKRQANFGGKVDSIPKGFKIDWIFKTAENFTETKFGRWGGGTGWTGQPVYVEWPDSILSVMKAGNAVNPDFSGKEIIFGSLCGNLYFVDYSTGEPSRPFLPGTNPIKGSVSLDPTLNGNLYVGQGVPIERPFGAFCFNLITNTKTFFQPEDSGALRHWGAFDSSSVRVGQFLYYPGENGSVYKYLISSGTPKLHTVLRYTVNGGAPGIEASMSVYSNYGFVTDNHGNVIGINLDTMQPVWLYRLGDDTDSSPVIEVEDGTPFLYTGCEIDRQGEQGTAKFVKLNALNGQEIWKVELPGKKFLINEKHFDGGYYATSLPGTGNCADRIFALCVRNTVKQNGELLAIDKKTGHIIYQTPLKHYAWSSPVGFEDKSGNMFVVAADCIGNMYIIDGKKGDILHSQPIGANFESSPVVVGNSFVVGSRGNQIFKITLQ